MLRMLQRRPFSGRVFGFGGFRICNFIYTLSDNILKLSVLLGND